MPVEIKDLGRARNFCQSSSARPSFSKRSLRTDRRSGLVAAITHYTNGQGDISRRLMGKIYLVVLKNGVAHLFGHIVSRPVEVHIDYVFDLLCVFGHCL